jgi:hypothetical protein
MFKKIHKNLTKNLGKNILVPTLGIKMGCIVFVRNVEITSKKVKNYPGSSI